MTVKRGHSGHSFDSQKLESCTPRTRPALISHSFVMQRPPPSLPSPSDPRGICESIAPFCPSSYVRPQFLGCRKARSQHRSRGKPDRPHFPIRTGYAPMRPTMDPGPDDSAWWSGWKCAGSVSRGSRLHFPEWLILDDVHHSSQSHAVPFCYWDKILLLQDQPCLASHTDAA
ncbi:uncharacterized protein LY79DRAFT_548933 [Colletotrichum navitas]|uniref:Uncharacterized protein n=1 Tax=Colletotrichum navitas TaxID=681940 RepID=A0AAD8Q274_9PEZI|nr:uncharacterized protein LY79DRAFT_548933 [Colletotrichum navitas]KAK1594525.1 hypothetical protein LY79DRAFT_548933 [Colletotrichum navitas]